MTVTYWSPVLSWKLAFLPSTPVLYGWSRLVDSWQTQTVMPQSPPWCTSQQPVCGMGICRCDDGRSWFPYELSEVIVADTHCDGRLGHAHRHPVDHCSIVCAVKVNQRHCELSNALPFRLILCLQNSAKGEFTNLWSIVGHRGQQQVFGVSEVAVPLDDAVHDVCGRDSTLFLGYSVTLAIPFMSIDCMSSSWLEVLRGTIKSTVECYSAVDLTCCHEYSVTCFFYLSTH